MEMSVLHPGRMLRPQRTPRKRCQNGSEPCEMSEGPGALPCLGTSLMGAPGTEGMLLQPAGARLELECCDTGDVEGTGLL